MVFDENRKSADFACVSNLSNTKLFCNCLKVPKIWISKKITRKFRDLFRRRQSQTRSCHSSYYSQPYPEYNSHFYPPPHHHHHHHHGSELKMFIYSLFNFIEKFLRFCFIAITSIIWFPLLVIGFIELDHVINILTENYFNIDS